MSHHEAVEHGFDPSLAEGMGGRKWTWKNTPGYKPIFFIVAAMVFTFLVIMPPTQGMLEMVKLEKPAGYSLASGAKTIADTVNKKLRPEAYKAQTAGQTTADENSGHGHVEPLLTDYQGGAVWPR